MKRRIYMIRHSTYNKESGLLDDQGRLIALKKGLELESQLSDDLICFCSSQIRTKETLARIIGAKYNISVEDEYEHAIKTLYDYDREIRSEESLEFPANPDKDSYCRKAGLDALREKRYIEFLVEESDRLAEEHNDQRSIAYSKMVKSVDELIKRNIPQKEEESTGDIICCSHLGVIEPWLIEKVSERYGKDAKRDLVRTLRAGFEPCQGYVIEISQENPDKNDLISIDQEIISRIGIDLKNDIM